MSGKQLGGEHAPQSSRLALDPAGRGPNLLHREYAGEAGIRKGGFVAGMTVIFIGMFLVILYVTGVYEQGIRPHLEPIIARARSAWQGEGKLPTGQATLSQSSTASSHAAQSSAVEPDRQSPTEGDKQATQGIPEKAPDSKQLVRVYERMRPKDAASIVEQLEIPLAVEILSQMPDRQAARILGAMTPERAARITAKLAERSL